MSTSGLYFIAIAVPEPHASDIRALQQHAAEHFESKHALRTPPHITIVPPFRMDRQKSPALLDTVRNQIVKWPAAEIRLDGFGHFSDRVIYINVAMDDAMLGLVGELNQVLHSSGFIKQETRQFNPHVTIAHRDLVPENFQAAFAYFKTQPYSVTLPIRELCLMEHSGHTWRVGEILPMP